MTDAANLGSLPHLVGYKVFKLTDENVGERLQELDTPGHGIEIPAKVKLAVVFVSNSDCFNVFDNRNEYPAHLLARRVVVELESEVSHFG
jgi:hypothetical protein